MARTAEEGDVSDTAASAADAQASPEPEVSARPERLRPWCAGLGLLIVIALAIVAVLLPHDADGTTFHSGDQYSVFGVGLLLAGACWLPTRPRLRADRTALHVRGMFGPYKTVPWSVVRSVEFRSRWRWARVVLPADETISLYAVQRLDGARSVAVMRALRELHAAAHEALAHEAFAREVQARQADTQQHITQRASARVIRGPELPGGGSPSG
jgi:PH (Pleckstrin Homology) domain-containing protein